MGNETAPNGELSAATDAAKRIPTEDKSAASEMRPAETLNARTVNDGIRSAAIALAVTQANCAAGKDVRNVARCAGTIVKSTAVREIVRNAELNAVMTNASSSARIGARTDAKIAELNNARIDARSAGPIAVLRIAGRIAVFETTHMIAVTIRRGEIRAITAITETLIVTIGTIVTGVITGTSTATIATAMAIIIVGITAAIISGIIRREPSTMVVTGRSITTRGQRFASSMTAIIYRDTGLAAIMDTTTIRS